MILALVALWRFTPPPRALAADGADLASICTAKRPWPRSSLRRDAARGARVSVLVLDGEFRPLAAKEVVLVVSNVAAGIEPLRRAAVGHGRRRWRIEDLRIPVAGEWLVRVEILVSDFEKVMLEQTVVLPRVP